MNTQKITNHPSDEQLTEFVAGSLTMSRALCIATHIEHCSKCKKRLQSLQLLGSAQLESIASAKVSNSLKDKVLASIKAPQQPNESAESASANQQHNQTTPAQYSSPIADSAVPRPLRRWVSSSFDDIAWSTLTPSVSIFELSREGNGAKAALVKVKAGGNMAHHSHTGEEVTVVLQGSFSDEDGCYLAGDYLFRNKSHKHEPVASKDQDCICLIVLDGPIQFTGWFSRLINPILRMKHQIPMNV